LVALSDRFIAFRQFNNWVKSTLISRFCPRGAIVLDFCSGKSGDMQKLIAAGAAHVVSCGASCFRSPRSHRALRIHT
jgi:hypothetical protein